MGKIIFGIACWMIVIFSDSIGGMFAGIGILTALVMVIKYLVARMGR